jgi:hypothetical protein
MTNEINTSGINETFEEYLEHHGIKGMHWGIRRTPEQLGHKVSKAREKFEKYGKKASTAAESGNAKAFDKYKKKAEKTYKTELKLNEQLQKAIKRQNEADEKVVNKGSLDDVLAISDRLTKEQLDKAYNRISSKQKLESLRPSAESKIDKLVSVGGKVATGAGHAYNIINNVNNFKKVVEDIQQSEIKQVEAAREKERKQKVNKAIKTGKVEEFKKVFNEANINELKEMSDTLKMRYEIENMDYDELKKKMFNAPAWTARSYSTGGNQQQKK